MPIRKDRRSPKAPGAVQRLLFDGAQTHPLVDSVAAVAEQPTPRALPLLEVEAGRDPVLTILLEGGHLRSSEGATLSQSNPNLNEGSHRHMRTLSIVQ